jgi:hypothetical protein
MKLVALSPSSSFESRVKVTLDSGKEHELYLESNLELDQKTDPWLYLLLPVCLRLGEDLEVQGTLSKEAIAAFERAKQELLTGHSYMRPMKLIYNQEYAESDKPDKTKGVGSFFSGGLDSAYSAETEKEVDSLICVWGFDISISNPTHWNLTKDLVESYSSSLGKRPVTVKTNVRAVFNDVLEWGRDYHGSALAGVGSALSKHFKAVYIAAGYKRVETNWGHFPALAKAYSTPSIQVGESGPVRRIEKADALANNPRTPQMRVCYRNVKGLANCGTCKKCVRTRLEFDLINTTKRPLGLEKRPRLKELLATKINRADYKFYLDAIKYARAKGSKNTIAPLLAVSYARLNSKTQTLLAKLTKKKDPIQGNPRISNQKS